MSKPGRQSVSCSGFLIPETGELFISKPEKFNFETVIQSFRDFIAEAPLPEGKKYCMILDNAPWHQKAIKLVWTESLPEYQDIRDKLTYETLPPYSPDLNPIEQVWRITRREVTHNRYFKSKDILESSLDSHFLKLRKPNDRLRTLCGFKCYRDSSKAA